MKIKLKRLISFYYLTTDDLCEVEIFIISEDEYFIRRTHLMFESNMFLIREDVVDEETKDKIHTIILLSCEILFYF